MGQPAARLTDSVRGADTHLVLVPAPPGAPVPTLIGGHVFSGPITGGCVASVLIGGLPAATEGSAVSNIPPHVPVPPGTAFVRVPANRGTVATGSATVLIGGKPAARIGDSVHSCNDPVDLPTSKVASGALAVMIG